MTKSVVLLFSIIFSLFAFADTNTESYALPVEEWSDSDESSDQVFAVLDEELDNAEYEQYEKYEEYEEVEFDEQGQVIEPIQEQKTYRQDRYEETNNDQYFAHASHRHSPRRTHRHRHRHRRPVVVVPPPVIFPPPLVSNICRSGPYGNGFYFCYFVDGIPRPVGNTCSCYLRNAYTGERIFFKGRVSLR